MFPPRALWNTPTCPESGCSICGGADRIVDCRVNVLEPRTSRKLGPTGPGAHEREGYLKPPPRRDAEGKRPGKHSAVGGGAAGVAADRGLGWPRTLGLPYARHAAALVWADLGRARLSRDCLLPKDCLNMEKSPNSASNTVWLILNALREVMNVLSVDSGIALGVAGTCSPCCTSPSPWLVTTRRPNSRAILQLL